MSKHFTVWVWCRRDDAGYEIPKAERIWEISESGCGPKTAERIAREVRHDFGCPTKVLPEGVDPN